MSGTSTSVVGGGGGGEGGMGYGYGYRPPFTAVQWQELEHQAMIYKYLVAGLPVPPDLVVPIRRSFEAISARFFHHPSLGYCSYYGKKFDPEPGRCRRTDGKKWRCSKDAYPDSKYCERHMHRGRNRSRKPVESQSTPQSLSTSMSQITAGSSNTRGSFQNSSSGSFQNMPLYSVANSGTLNYGSTGTKLQMEPVSYGIDNKDYRYLHGITPDADEHNLSSEASATVRSLGMRTNTDSTWVLPSQISSSPMARSKNDSQLLGSSTEMHLPNLLEPMIDATISKRRHQHCFFGSDIDSPGTVKEEQHSMRPFFNEWPTAKESWSNLDDEGSNKNNFSTTQLSMSIPIAPSNFSSRSACSPNDT
ncbi:growth-regulating factor 4-like isoform X1 [Solanum lycopersicum]|uniref:Growth-regulating factor n=2 Tax=Solanum lycopersicum TaxID=4081 RepID=A0A3Q7HTE3_SOLLC|nr:growth-regulating factor 4-like [Solanum lycopersicum]